MNIKPVGSNQVEVELSSGITVLYSYRTPVAVFVPGKGALCTSQKWSCTTSRHINNAVVRWGCSRHNVPQDEINNLANGVSAV